MLNKNLTLIIVVLALIQSCDKESGPKGDKGDPGDIGTSSYSEKNGGSSNGDNNYYPNDDGGGGGPGSLALSPTVDVQGAFGLMAMDKQEGAALALLGQHNRTVTKLGLTAEKFTVTNTDSRFSLLGGESPYSINGQEFTFFEKPLGFQLLEGNSDSEGLRKIREDGSVTSAISTDCFSQETESNPDDGYQQPCEELPQISTIAKAPTGELYFHFDRPYIYRIPEDNSVDVWDQSNGYQCQVFKVSGGTIDELIASPATANNLECIDNTHFIDQWRSGGNGVFQFDAAGNVYYPGSIPNNGKMVLYRRTRDGSSTTEVINSNICVQDYLITPTGGTFYTGNTCSDDGGGGGGGGFFRYVAPGAGGQVIEIARDWWNFIYDARVATDGSGTVSDKAVFFGPDPRDSGTAGWDSACIFEFDPSQSDPASRISEVITCGNDIWGWMELRRQVDIAEFGEGFYDSVTWSPNVPTTGWKTEFQRRCEIKDQVFAGGGSQISAIQQDENGQIYVIGNIQKKAEGELACNIEVRGPHCLIENIPLLTYTSSDDCANDSGTWIDEGNCNNGASSSSCLNHTRQWIPEICSNDPETNITESACLTANGYWYDIDGTCSDNTFTNESDCLENSYSWADFHESSCSNNTDTNQTDCVANSATWSVSWYDGNDSRYNGRCEDTLTGDLVSQYNYNPEGCEPSYNTQSSWYNNVKADFCSTSETGNRATWYDWDAPEHRYTDLATLNSSATFIVQNFSCLQTDGSGNGNWTSEYSALAKVNSTKKSLELISLSGEKAIDLWISGNKVFYASYDSGLGQYLLNTLDTTGACIDQSKDSDSCTGGSLTWKERQCVDSSIPTEGACDTATLSWSNETPEIILEDFETYHIARTGSANQVYADGLDFSDNSYKFGKIDTVSGNFTANTGLTGRVNNITILGN